MPIRYYRNIGWKDILGQMVNSGLYQEFEDFFLRAVGSYGIFRQNNDVIGLLFLN